MTTFEFINRSLALCIYLTSERLLSHHSLKAIKNGRRQYLMQMFMLSAFQDRSTLYIVYLCLLELLVVKNYVELEKKTASGKNKG